MVSRDVGTTASTQTWGGKSLLPKANFCVCSKLLWLPGNSEHTVPAGVSAANPRAKATRCVCTCNVRWSEGLATDHCGLNDCVPSNLGGQTEITLCSFILSLAHRINVKSDNFKNFITLKTNQGYRNPDKAVPTVGFLIFFLLRAMSLFPN